MAQVQIIQPYFPQSEELEKVAAYCRVSTDSKDQLNSYRTQIGYYTNYIAQHPGWELADIYADEGITGTSLEKRDEFKRMLADCRAGKIQRILVKSVSRFARNTLELIETTRELKERGVVVVFEEQGIDTSQMLGEMQLTLLAMAAQEESSSISKNVRWSYQKRMESGRFLGCSAPYGYKLEKGTFAIVPEEAMIVKRIFDLFLAGNGILSIARTLNEEGIKTRQGANWATSSIEYLLSNERYAGNSIFQKYYSTDSFPTKRKINHGERTQYYIGDTHVEIIPKETFEKAQQVLENHAHYAPYLPKPFQKKIVCPDCGNFFRETTIRGKHYWICRNRRNNQASCTPVRITEQEIQGAFLNLLGKLYTQGRTILSPTFSLLEEIAARQEKGNQKLCEINIALADLNEKAHSLQRLHNKGFIEDEDFREQSDTLAAQRKKLSSQRAKAVHGSKALEPLDRLRELQEQLDALPEIPWKFDIGLFDQLVEKIVPISNTELLFKLKCGLELKEVLPK